MSANQVPHVTKPPTPERAAPTLSRQDSIILEEEEVDPNYEPTEKEIIEYATWLGIDEAEKGLRWIARKALKAKLPDDWKPLLKQNRKIPAKRDLQKKRKNRSPKRYNELLSLNP